MPLRIPRSLAAPGLAPAFSSALDYEAAQEMAAALGRLGRRLEASLQAIEAFEASRSDAADDRRATLVAAAGEALWLFIVQREACGLADAESVMRNYRVPRCVRAAMGVFRADVPRPR
jgi:hypothetical protein